MRIETTRYKHSHGKNPSGFGLWAFEVQTTEGRQTITAPQAMAYTDAKVWALRQARAIGADEQIFVAP